MPISRFDTEFRAWYQAKGLANIDSFKKVHMAFQIGVYFWFFDEMSKEKKIDFYIDIQRHGQADQSYFSFTFRGHKETFRDRKSAERQGVQAAINFFNSY